MPPTRLALAVVLATGCHRSLDLGSEPHLLGRLAHTDIHGDRRRLAFDFPELEQAARSGTHDVVDSPLKYRVWFDDADHIESFIIFVDLPLDDVLAAWGPGTPATDLPGHHVYADAKHGIRFDVAPPPERDSNERCVVRAEPMWPLAEVLGDTRDIRVLGLDLLDLKWGEIGATLATKGVTLKKLPGLDDARSPIKAVLSNHFATEVGKCQLHLRAPQSGAEIVSFELSCAPDVRGGREQLLAAIERKWGKPTPGKLGAFGIERLIYPETTSQFGEAVRVSLDDGVIVSIYVDPLRDDPYRVREWNAR